MFVVLYAEAAHKAEFADMKRSIDIFWPLDQNCTMTVVLDNEDTRAHDWARELEQIPFVNVRFQSPNDRVYNGVGHTRQQWTKFWADNYTAADYIAFVEPMRCLSRLSPTTRCLTSSANHAH